MISSSGKYLWCFSKSSTETWHALVKTLECKKCESSPMILNRQENSVDYMSFGWKLRGEMQQSLGNKINTGSWIRKRLRLHLTSLFPSAGLGLALSSFLIHTVESLVTTNSKFTCSCSVSWRNPPLNFSWLQGNIFVERADLPSLGQGPITGHIACYQINKVLL